MSKKRAKLIAMTVLTAVIFFALATVVAGCGKGSDKGGGKGVYTEYGYSPVKGTIVAGSYTLTLQADNKYIYQGYYGAEMGEYRLTDKSLVLYEGGMDRLDAEQYSFLRYNSYLFHAGGAYMTRIPETEFGETEKLEGLYYIGGSIAMLKEGGLYISDTGSEHPDDLDVKVASYTLKDDIISLDFDSPEFINEFPSQFLTVVYDNQYGQPQRTMVSYFMSDKKIEAPVSDISLVEYEQRVFAKNEAGEYNLNIIKYPSKTTLDGVTYKVTWGGSEEFPATVEDAKLKFGGTGSVYIEARQDGKRLYGTYITIIEAKLKSQLEDEPFTAVADQNNEHWVGNFIDLSGEDWNNKIKWSFTVTVPGVAKTGEDMAKEGKSANILIFKKAGETKVTVKLMYVYEQYDHAEIYIPLGEFTFDAVITQE